MAYSRSNARIALEICMDWRRLVDKITPQGLQKTIHVNVSLALQNASLLLYFWKLELTFTAQDGSLFIGTIAWGTAQPPRASQRGSFLYLPSPILGDCAALRKEGRVRA